MRADSASPARPWLMLISGARMSNSGRPLMQYLAGPPIRDQRVYDPAHRPKTLHGAFVVRVGIIVAVCIPKFRRTLVLACVSVSVLLIGASASRALGTHSHSLRKAPRASSNNSHRHPNSHCGRAAPRRCTHRNRGEAGNRRARRHPHGDVPRPAVPTGASTTSGGTPEALGGAFPTQAAG